MAKKQAKKGAPQGRRSPLYTSKRRELEKRELLAEIGRDTDGAYRIKNRQDNGTSSRA